MVNVYTYWNHRDLLRDLYQFKKEESLQFSHRVIAEKLGIKSPGIFSNILVGRSNVTDAMVSRFAKMFEFSVEEAMYFHAMVQFNQAHDGAQQRFWQEQMHSMRAGQIEKVQPEQFEYFARWYYPAIHALIKFCTFKGRYANLAGKLRPQITAQQAREAVKLLVKLGLIEKGEDGVYRQVHPFLTSGSDEEHRAFNSFHLQTMNIAQQSMDTVPVAERQFSGVTLGMPEAALPQARKVLAKCRKSLLSLAKGAGKPEQLYYFGFYQIPMSKCRKRRWATGSTTKRTKKG